MRLLVVGAGATGGYFGGRLAAAGRDVTFLVRSGRKAQLEARGLEIVSPHGDVTVKPRLVTADAIDGPYDAILLTVKGYGLAGALDDIAPAVGPETVIVPVLNGIGHMDALIARFGADRVAGGVCKIAATIDGDGRVVQLSQLQYLAYGEMDGRRSARMVALDALMTDAGFPAQLSDNIAREMWEKWLLLASLGAITCLMRGTIGETVAAPGGRAFASAVVDEVVTIIRAVGVAPSDAAVEGTRTLMTQEGSPFASSMFRDLSAGNAVEADEIVGDLVRRGQGAGIAASLLSAAYAHLMVYANRRG
jgi:2-dehydropantoate 2-reductase